MKLRTKRKIKHCIAWLLGIITILVALVISYFFDKLIETIITIILFYIYRCLFEKQWHANSMLGCFFVTSIVLIIIINIEVKITISILFSAILTFILTLISYYVKDYFDDKLLVNNYKNKLEKYNTKCIENLTEDEMAKLMPGIRYETIHIVYGYLHRPKTLNSTGYAYRCNISERTLFRYVKQIKEKYESLGK